MILDDRMLEYASPRQAEIARAVAEHGDHRSAAEALGINRSNVSRALQSMHARAARAGYSPEHDLTHPVPPGYKLRGSSTLYDADGKQKLQWVKTTEDIERREQMLREWAEAFAEDLPRTAPLPLTVQHGSNDDLLAVYPVGDHHIGMYGWREEAGGDWDLVLAENTLAAAFCQLTVAFPTAGRALVAFLGDLFHYDGLEPVTPRGKNLLDSDGRYAKMIRVGLRLTRRTIDAALLRHSSVTVIVQAGNHDPSTALFLAEALRAFYEHEPRVEVDTSPRQFHYHEHGANLVGVCHGHEVRNLAELPLVMASDRPDAWGRTRHRYWYTGHVHKDRVLDVQGTRVESFRVLPPTDAYAESHGYRGVSEMKALLLDARHGEVQRVAVRPEMFA